MSAKEIEALEFAFNSHAQQVDKQGKPYIPHVLRVAMANFAGCSENMFIAGLLHDAVEDCGVELSEIERRFGARIAMAVDCLSRRKDESYSAYISRLKQDKVAVRVKLADLNDNLMESRIGSLAPEDQKRLRRRYAKALAELQS